MKLLMFAASLQKASLNKKLITLAATLLEEAGHTVDLVDFSEFDLPLYNADIQAKGFPASLTQFTKKLQASDGLIISSPEYNFSTPGTLKNLIDWVSRVTPQPWQSHPVYLASASPSLVGGNRGLWSTRIPLEACSAHVFPDMFSLSAADKAFDESGKLNDGALQERLKKSLLAFVSFVNKLKSVND